MTQPPHPKSQTVHPESTQSLNTDQLRLLVEMLAELDANAAAQMLLTELDALSESDPPSAS